MASTKPNWQQRSAELKKAAVLEILRRSAMESELSAIKRVARKYNGRNLPGGKNLRLSIPTLRRLWYAWKANPSDSVFDLHYVEGQRKEMPVWQVKLMEAFAIQHGLSLGELHTHLKALDSDFPYSRDSFYRHLSEETKQRIAKAVKLRKAQEALDLEKEKLTGGKA